MASPNVKVTAMTGLLAQRLRSTGSETTIDFSTTSTDPWSSLTNGFLKINTGTSSEWVYFGGLTINSSTSATATSCVRGMKKDAATISDAQSSNKKDHEIGTTVKYVEHSFDLNSYVQKTADNTISGANTFSGANTVSGSATFTSTTVAGLRLPRVTTTQRDAYTGTITSAIIDNSTTGIPEIYAGGSWYPLSTGSTQPNASTTVAGKVEIATGAEQIAMTATGGTGAILMVPNDSTERFLNGMHNSTATQLRLGYNNTGSRVTEIDFISDTTYTSGGFIISRGASGANSDTTLTHRGTGDLKILVPEAGYLNLIITSHCHCAANPASVDAYKKKFV